MVRLIFLSLLIVSNSIHAVDMSDLGWFHSVALRTHVDIVSENQEVSGSIKLTPVDKLSAAYQTSAGGNYYFEYARAFKLSNQLYFSADLGYFDMVEEESIGYLGAMLSYVPRRDVVLSLDFTETESIRDYSMLEHRSIALSTIWKPNNKSELMLQATRIQPKGIMQDLIGNYNEYEAYASYQCTKDIKPYVYSIQRETSKDMSVNLGVEFNFN